MSRAPKVDFGAVAGAIVCRSKSLRANSKMSRALSPATISAIEALDRLEQESPESAQVARLRFLSGFSIEQTAILLDIAPRTVSKRWNYARAWLRRAIAEAA